MVSIQKLAWIPVAAFLWIWMTTRVISYFMWTQDAVLADMVGMTLPAQVNQTVVKWLGKEVIAPMMTVRLLHLRTHIALSVLMGVTGSINLMQFVRNRYPAFHRTLGSVYMLAGSVFIAHMWYYLLILGMAPMGDVIYWTNVLSAIVMTITLPLAGYFITNRNFSLHRSMMIMNFAALSVNAAQRFFWPFFGKLRNGGNWQTGPDFINVAAAESMIVAAVFCFGMGLYHAFGPPSAKISLPPGVSSSVAKKSM